MMKMTSTTGGSNARVYLIYIKRIVYWFQFDFFSCFLIDQNWWWGVILVHYFVEVLAYSLCLSLPLSVVVNIRAETYITKNDFIFFTLACITKWRDYCHSMFTQDWDDKGWERMVALGTINFVSWVMQQK